LLLIGVPVDRQKRRPVPVEVEHAWLLGKEITVRIPGNMQPLYASIRILDSELTMALERRMKPSGTTVFFFARGMAPW
jgi:hypothetical protein